jgi:hypothetical protein
VAERAANVAIVEDFEIQQSGGPEPPPPTEPTTSGRHGTGSTLAVALLLILALGGGGYFLYSVFVGPDAAETDGEPTAPDEPAGPLPTPAPPAPAAEPDEEAPPPPPPLPPLDQSDATVRTMAVTLSRHPKLTRWLATDEMVRRFVRVVANVAYGEPPRSHVRFLAPEGTFEVQGEGDDLRVDPRSYARYDVLTEVFVPLDDDGLVELYGYLRPLFEEAYRELGYPDASFDRLLHRGANELLRVPVVEPDVHLEPRVISYEYADPTLEELTDPQKQLLRMGPINVRRVQEKLRRLLRLLELT